MNARLTFFLITAVILLVFFPTFSGEICKIDDSQLIKALQQTPTWTLKSLFTPGSQGGLYYRPLLGLSFFIDKDLFSLSSFSLHAENIFLHLLNTFFVFLVTKQLLLAETKQQNYPLLPVASALLFGVHPLTTESANWISGRSDLMMATFLLFSTLLLLHYRISNQRWLLLPATASMTCSFFAKEVGIAFVPGFFLIATAHGPDVRQYLQKRQKMFLIFFALVALSVSLFFAARHLAFSSDSSRISITFKYLEINPAHSLFLFLRALGFYIKKIFIPWPLNFAITHVDPLYELLAFLVLPVLLYLLWRRTLPAALFMTGIFLITPTFLIALNQIAWTPYAERYLYAPLAFMLPPMCLWLSKQIASPKTRTFLFCFIFSVSVVTTSYRNHTWQTNLGILADTAAKAPRFKTIQWVYGAALANAGQYQHALAVTKHASKLRGSPLSFEQQPLVNIGYLYLVLERFDNAATAFHEVLSHSNQSIPALQGLTELHSILALRKDLNRKSRLSHYQSARTFGRRLFAFQHDPMILYRIGQLALACNDIKTAKKSFSEAHKLLPHDNEYKRYSDKLLRSLSLQTQS